MVQTIDDSVQLLWNKGVAALCDWRIPDEFPEGRYCLVPTEASALATSKTPDDLIQDPEFYRGVRDGDLVWVRLAWLKSFIKQVLPLIDARFVLVTGDSDTSVPSEIPFEAEKIFGNPKILLWYTQNYDGSANEKRISPIPIGLDLHTLSDRAAWGEQRSSPPEQEFVLESVRQSLPSLSNRLPKVYSDFAFQPRWDGSLTDRKSLLKRIPEDLLFSQREILPRSEMWRSRGKYAFVLSPHGYGLDCHRTWEALALGHIVVVASSPLDPLYSGLPVVVVQDWSEVTSENLQRWLSMYGDPQASMSPQLTNQYWAEQMRSLIRVRLNSDARYPMPRRLGHSIEGLYARSLRRLRRAKSASKK